MNLSYNLDRSIFLEAYWKTNENKDFFIFCRLKVALVISLRYPALSKKSKPEETYISNMPAMTNGSSRADKKNAHDIEVAFSDIMRGAQYTKINPMSYAPSTNIGNVPIPVRYFSCPCLQGKDPQTLDQRQEAYHAAQGLLLFWSLMIVINTSSSPSNQKFSPRHIFKKKCRLPKNGMPLLMETSGIKPS